jgi:hypothetical protein
MVSFSTLILILKKDNQSITSTGTTSFELGSNRLSSTNVSIFFLNSKAFSLDGKVMVAQSHFPVHGMNSINTSLSLRIFLTTCNGLSSRSGIYLISGLSHFVVPSTPIPPSVQEEVFTRQSTVKKSISLH